MLRKCIKNISKMLQICLFFSLEITYFLPKHNLFYSRVVCYVRKSQQEANPSLTHKPFAKHCQTKKSGNVRHQTGGLLRFVSQGRVLDISSVFSFRMLGKDQQSKVSYKFSSGSHYKFKKVILTT